MTRAALLLVLAVVVLLTLAGPASAARTGHAKAIETATLRFRTDTTAAIRASRPELRRLRASAVSCLGLLKRLPAEALDEADAVLYAEADRVLAGRAAPALRQLADDLGALPRGEEPIIDATIGVWARAARQLEAAAADPAPAFCPRVRLWLRKGVGDTDLSPAGYRYRSDLSDAGDVLNRALRRLFQLGVKGAAARMWSSEALIRPFGAVVDLIIPRALAEMGDSGSSIEEG